MESLHRREAAPFSDRVWKQIDEAVRKAAVHVLAGRRVADFDGPKGWDYVASRLGHDGESAHLFCVETVAAQLITPDAVCVLSSPMP